jgi:hypothetical protein
MADSSEIGHSKRATPRFKAHLTESLPGLTRQSMLIVISRRFTVLFDVRHVSMDHRVKPGGDEEGDGQILRVIPSAAKQSSDRLAQESRSLRHRRSPQ